LSLGAADDDFWADLIALVRARQVVPVIGADLLWSRIADQEIPFYELVAKQLIAPYEEKKRGGDEWLLRPQSLLSDAVCTLAALKKRPVADCYLWVHQALQALLKEHRAYLENSHRTLAAIEDFRLFVSTTPDDVLAQAIDSVRYGGTGQTQQIEYSPSSLSKGHQTDLAEQWTDGQSAVLYLFGKMNVAPSYAVHDEDMLEFIHGLQAGLGPVPKHFFSEMRNANLLLIGCQFPDWIARFLMRLTAAQRLSEQRGRRDFVIDRTAERRSDFVVFVEQFAGSTQVLSSEPRAFVRELLARWQASRMADGTASAKRATEPQTSLRPRAAIFISYSRTDIDAARKLNDELTRIAGNDIAWFDKDKVKPGDEWPRLLKEAIRACDLFMPVISRSAEGRTEAEFIDEWRTASERWRRIDGKKFVIPVCVDAGANESTIANYTRAQTFFGKADFGFAPGGALTPTLEDTLVRELRALRKPHR
jgi:hypothetical protein